MLNDITSNIRGVYALFAALLLRYFSVLCGTYGDPILERQRDIHLPMPIHLQCRSVPRESCPVAS